jgi:hypothetical protein
MSVVIIDGRVKVTWATAVANIAAPTVAELNAGTALQGLITPDGLKIDAKTGKVNSSNLGSKTTTYKAGRKEYDVSLTFHHDSPTDTAYNVFTYRAAGYLVVRRGVDATTAWTVADKVEVYPLEAAEPNQENPAPDSTWDFETEFFLTADENTHAVVA